MPSRRSRAIKLPPVPQFTIKWHAPLFTAKDVQRIGKQVRAEDGRLVVTDDVDPKLVAYDLNKAFHNAIVSSVMLDRFWQQDSAWFKRLSGDVRRMLATLGLTPEQCIDMAALLPSDEALPGIYHLREAARAMPPGFWPPIELLMPTSRQPTEQLVNSAKATEETVGPAPGREDTQDPGQKAMADGFLQLLPRILGLTLLLSEACAATTARRPAGAGADILRRELYPDSLRIRAQLLPNGANRILPLS